MESPRPLKRRELTVLLIQPVNSQVDVRAALIDAGHQVVAVERPADAARVMRCRRINLILIVGVGDTISLLETAASVRGAGERQSTRYTPIFAVLRESPTNTWSKYIDAVLTEPLNSEALLKAYLDFLARNLTNYEATSEQESCCQIDAAIARLGGDIELYKDLVGRFLDDSAGSRRRLEEAIGQSNAAAVHRAAHSLKGLAASIGAVEVADILAKLEICGRTEDVAGIADEWQRFRCAMERTADALSLYSPSCEFSSPRPS